MNSGFKANNFSKFIKLQKKLLIIGSLLLFIFVLVEFFGIRSSLSPKNIKDLF